MTDPKDGPITTNEKRAITMLVIALSLLFAWWLRTETGLALLAIATGVAVSLCLWTYWFLMELDMPSEEEWGGWLEDDDEHN